jgi:hypothetical protein
VLRNAFGTHLSKAGVTPRVAQAAMEKLPPMPLEGVPEREERTPGLKSGIPFFPSGLTPRMHSAPFCVRHLSVTFENLRQ